MDEYLEITRASKREEFLQTELTRIRDSFSFRFGNLFVQALERPITIPLLPFKITSFFLGTVFKRKKPAEAPQKITRNCIVGYSSESSQGIHFERIERILAEFRTYGIQTVHITNDREIRMFQKTKYHSLYSIPPRSEFNDMIPRTWNRKVEQIISGILDTFHPRTMIFDGDYPFRGVLNALSLRPEMNRFWVRESLLNFKISSLPVDGFDTFDAIIHPSLSRRDDPDAIIGSSGTIFCNPIVGSTNSNRIVERLRKKTCPQMEQLIFAQISRHIRNREQIFEKILAMENIKILCLSSSIPKQFLNHQNVVISNHLTTNEAIQISDACFISPNFYNLYSCFNSQKPTLCITESKGHIDSIYREFGTKKLPIILIDDENDLPHISNAIERLLTEELQRQLIGRMEELVFADGTPELCNYLNQLHQINQVITDSND